MKMLLVGPDCLITVNRASGRFDRESCDAVRVIGPREFVAMDLIQPLIRQIAE